MITTTDVHNFFEKLARQITYNPDKAPKEPKEPPASGGKGRRGPSGGCWINGNYYNPCPKNPNKPGL